MKNFTGEATAKRRGNIEGSIGITYESPKMYKKNEVSHGL